MVDFNQSSYDVREDDGVVMIELILNRPSSQPFQAVILPGDITTIGTVRSSVTHVFSYIHTLQICGNIIVLLEIVTVAYTWLAYVYTYICYVHTFIHLHNNYCVFTHLHLMCMLIAEAFNFYFLHTYMHVCTYVY